MNERRTLEIRRLRDTITVVSACDRVQIQLIIHSSFFVLTEKEQHSLIQTVEF